MVASARDSLIDCFARLILLCGAVCGICLAGCTDLGVDLVRQFRVQVVDHQEGLTHARAGCVQPERLPGKIAVLTQACRNSRIELTHACCRPSATRMTKDSNVSAIDLLKQHGTAVRIEFDELI